MRKQMQIKQECWALLLAARLVCADHAPLGGHDWQARLLSSASWLDPAEWQPSMHQHD